MSRARSIGGLRVALVTVVLSYIDQLVLSDLTPMLQHIYSMVGDLVLELAGETDKSPPRDMPTLRRIEF